MSSPVHLAAGVAKPKTYADHEEVTTNLACSWSGLTGKAVGTTLASFELYITD
jgi:hypothetical protein